MKRATKRSRGDREPQRRRSQSTQTIDGTVYPADWNEAGEVIALDLVTGDDQVLRILNSDKFVDYQEANIEAQGIIERQHRAGKSIYIKRFQVVTA